MHPKSWTLLEVHIFMGKTGRKNRRYSTEFKMCVILDMREHHLSYSETVRKHWNITQGQEHNYMKRIQRWERIFLEEGAEGLMKERRGKSYRSKKGRPPKLDKKVEEDLIAENQRLRMEIEYLKKLSALVLADERENGKRRK